MKRLGAKAPKFALETELCARFIAALPKEWTAYAETGGWDILLVRGADGFQIGIQAKLKLGTNVFSQVCEEGSPWQVANSGPDCRAVLVPSCEGHGWGKIAAYMGITIIQCQPENPERPTRYYDEVYSPALPGTQDSTWREAWFETATLKWHALPEYIPDVAAGDSAPIQLTEWKIGALKIEAILEIRGYVTREDFKEIKIDHRRWISAGAHWLDVDEHGHLVAGPYFRNFKAQHPRVYAEIKAKAAEWMPAAPLLPKKHPELSL